MKKIFAIIISVLSFSLIAHAKVDSTFTELIGKYNFPDGSVVSDVVVTFENGVLSMASSAGTSTLEKTKDADVYIITQFQGTASFKRNASQKIDKVVIEAMGYHLEGNKEMPVSLFAEYIGKYKFPDGSVVNQVTVLLDGNNLTSASDAGTTVLEKVAGDTFNVVSFQGTAVFKRDANKKIIGVVIDAMGYRLEGKKED